MYQIGDLIICGNNGVCRVESIGKLDLSWIDKNKPYYTLHPIYQPGKLYVPIDTSIYMRPIITYEEAQQLIDRIPVISGIDCTNQNPKLLKEHYRELLHTHKCTDLIKLIKTIYEKNIDIKNSGKHLGQIDSKYIKQAEDLLYGELAIVLNIPKEQVRDYIAYRFEGPETLETVNL
ncbi:MAG: CarD family transcriptional regulator [Eubacteriales bacterium]|nr:CarD family transcriptional regulator [Eubacteriales bacterium]